MRALVILFLLCVPFVSTHAKLSLHELVNRGDSALVADAVSKRNINKRDKKGNTPLHYAAANADAEIVQLLIDNGADTNATNKKFKTTALHEIARTTSTNRRDVRNVTKILLQGGAVPGLVDDYGETALHAASRLGNAAVAKGLVDTGSHSDEAVEAALVVAREYGRYEVIRLLESRGVQSVVGTESGLLNAARSGNYAVVENLLRAGTPVDTRSEHEETPLILAAAQGHTQVVRQLLAQSADTNAESVSGETALHMAAGQGHRDIIDQLLKHGANINASSTSVGTPINSAGREERVDVVSYLVEKGGIPGNASETGEDAFGSGLGWLLFAQYHEDTATPETTVERKMTSSGMFEIAASDFEEKREEFEEMRRGEKRSDAIVNAIGTAVAVTATVALQRLQQQQAEVNRRQIVQIAALGDASSQEDYFSRYNIYKNAMINSVTESPYHFDFTDTTFANTDSVSGLDVFISEYERRLALIDKLQDSTE